MKGVCCLCFILNTKMQEQSIPFFVKIECVKNIFGFLMVNNSRPVLFRVGFVLQNVSYLSFAETFEKAFWCSFILLLKNNDQNQAQH